MEIVSFLVFERQKNEGPGWFSLPMLLNFSESKAFPREALVLGEISLYLSRAYFLFGQHRLTEAAIYG